MTPSPLFWSKDKQSSILVGQCFPLGSNQQKSEVIPAEVTKFLPVAAVCPFYSLCDIAPSQPFAPVWLYCDTFTTFPTQYNIVICFQNSFPFSHHQIFSEVVKFGIWCDCDVISRNISSCLWLTTGLTEQNDVTQQLDNVSQMWRLWKRSQTTSCEASSSRRALEGGGGGQTKTGRSLV